MSLLEVNEAAEVISQAVDPDARIIFGSVIDERLEGEIRITVIATGFSGVQAAKETKRFLESEDIDFKPIMSSDEIDAIPAFIRRKSG
jgi:cell division protein FtsZ